MMVLSLKEVARQLRMPVETVRRWVLQGKIPMQMNRGEYTIRQEMLRRWAGEHHLKIYGAPADETVPFDQVEPVFDGILPAMQRGGVFHDLKGDTKVDALRAAVERIPNIPPAVRDQLCAKLMEREQLASTGIGHGIAMPHPRSNPDWPLAVPQISTCFLARPVAFDAIDGRPVSVLMVLLSGSTRLHLTMMSKLAFHLRDKAFRDFLLAMPSAEALWAQVAAVETAGGQE
ncbi:PTS sugar transporter subunit IIA [Desulfatitalea alkaliphila]|uniref:PTS sugar transporter subunit IIA n=1 Tax=Desulfatitalea alkaliphila TaxID=2929485 RepID=A0AA41UIS9_9BACT|nr:PTS sugar transporter subunit IIA [Desulfatitalea alkaliphila]MCJ8500429.1 PTS sugar transporter subunit IIA [Desulfatitalea alkaliphila]